MDLQADEMQHKVVIRRSAAAAQLELLERQLLELKGLCIVAG